MEKEGLQDPEFPRLEAGQAVPVLSIIAAPTYAQPLQPYAIGQPYANGALPSSGIVAPVAAPVTAPPAPPVGHVLRTEDGGISRAPVVVLIVGFFLPLIWIGGAVFLLPNAGYAHRRRNRRLGWTSLSLAFVVIPLIVGLAAGCSPRVREEWVCGNPPPRPPGPYCPDCGPFYSYMIRQLVLPCQGGCKVPRLPGLAAAAAAAAAATERPQIKYSRNSWSYTGPQQACVDYWSLGEECKKDVGYMGFSII